MSRPWWMPSRRPVYGLPPKLAANIYTKMQHMILRLAARPGGVCRVEIMVKLGITRPSANKLVKELRLKYKNSIGRTEFFTVPEEMREWAETRNFKDDDKILMDRRIKTLEKKIEKMALELAELRVRRLMLSVNTDDIEQDKNESSRQSAEASIVGANGTSA